jgi:hypothetical protein
LPVTVMEKLMPGQDGKQDFWTNKVPVIGGVGVGIGVGVGVGAGVFLITQFKFCPALMVPVASSEPGALCLQSPVKVGLKPLTGSSCIVKEPGPNVTA